jgi:hypothetical protein
MTRFYTLLPEGIEKHETGVAHLCNIDETGVHSSAESRRKKIWNNY